MGTQEGELSGLVQPSNGQAAGGGLTPEQRAANLARVNAQLGVDDYVNPNMADTDAHLVEHGFRLDRGLPA